MIKQELLAPVFCYFLQVGRYPLSNCRYMGDYPHAQQAKKNGLPQNDKND